MASGETRLRQRILRALRAEGWFAYAQPASPFTGSGRADLICCAEGRFVAVEVKLPGEQPRPAQVKFIEDVIRAGGLAFTASSVEGTLELIHTYVRLMHGNR